MGYLLALVRRLALSGRRSAAPSPRAAARGTARPGRRSRLPAGVAAEDAGEGKLAELVPDHVLGDEHLLEFLAVVHQKRLRDELGDDRRAAGPGLDRPRLALVLGHHFLEQLRIDEGTLFQRTAHLVLPRMMCLVESFLRL